MKNRIVIIPAYNEVESLPKLWPELQKRLGADWDLLVVDDGSLDGTGEWLLENGVPCLRLPFNAGIGGAMQAGYKYAFNQGYHYALQLDGDGQHPPGQVERIYEAMIRSGMDMVIGSRFCGQAAYRPGFARAIGILVFRGLVKGLTKTTITDPTSGFRLANRRIIELFASDYPSDYPEVDTLIQLLGMGFRVAEVPVTMMRRTGGKTSISPWASAFYMLKVPFSIFLFLRNARKGGVRAPDPDHHSHG